MMLGGPDGSLGAEKVEERSGRGGGASSLFSSCLTQRLIGVQKDPWGLLVAGGGLGWQYFLHGQAGIFFSCSSMGGGVWRDLMGERLMG